MQVQHGGPMQDEVVVVLEAHIKVLERRIKNAIEQLHSLANESVHRSHGCPYPELDYEDMDEVISILEGKS
jgi:hypothetical protein